MRLKSILEAAAKPQLNAPTAAMRSSEWLGFVQQASSGAESLAKSLYGQDKATMAHADVSMLHFKMVALQLSWQLVVS